MDDTTITFRIDTTSIKNGLDRMLSQAALLVYCETVAKKFESYAKHNRPWKDRTGRARQGLTGYVQNTGKGFKICIAHTVDYGIWLEYARERKYSILEPTVRNNQDEVLLGLRALFK